ncbi:MAG: hypothetical protein HOO06_03320 [Bdellovibrionaceae bacterium]|jgi:hypothetical protein|nr:hypothetical protein [Pseudobdellovibrionaceae bacterium]
MLFYALLLSLMLMGNQSSAGSFAGNGSDSALKMHRQAWFIGENRSFSICLESNSLFPLNPKESKLAIERTLNQWINYVETRKIGFRYDIKDRLSLRYHWDSSCQDNTDLKFLLGIENDLVEKHRKRYIEPVAFAAKTEFAKWSRGFVWLSPVGTAKWPVDWKNPTQLQGILLHEIGHVFGNPHVENTIMTSHLKSLTNNGDNHLLWQIDGLEYLFLCRTCIFDETTLIKQSLPNFYKALELMLGRPIKGNLKRRLRSMSNGYKVILTVQDDFGSANFEFTSQSTFSVVNRGQIFNASHSVSRQALSSIYVGLVNGKMQKFILNLNSGSKIELSFLRENGKVETIFETRQVAIN